ncbi:MAG: hypothetical protein PHQ81_00210 [Methanofollis sp.]|nr:hypothetical protein [Methanofollis sp.]
MISHPQRRTFTVVSSGVVSSGVVSSRGVHPRTPPTDRGYNMQGGNEAAIPQSVLF